MDNIQVITLSVLTISVIYVLYLNYKKFNRIKAIEHRIKTLEKEFYTLDRKISEMPNVEHSELQADLNPNIARNSEMFRDILNSKNESINTEDLKQSENSEQDNLNYRKQNHIKSIEYRIKTLESEFYKLDRKISEMPNIEHSELQGDFNPTIARHSEMFRDILNSKNERMNTENLKQSDSPEQDNLNNLSKEELRAEDEDERKNKTQYEVLDDNCITDVLDNELKQEFNQYIMKTGEFESSDDEEETLEAFTNSNNYENQDDNQHSLNQSDNLITQDNIDMGEINLDTLPESVVSNEDNEVNEDNEDNDDNDANDNNLNTQLSELDENLETNDTHLDGGINLDFESNVSEEQCIIDNILSDSNKDIEIPDSLINNESDSNNYNEDTLSTLTVKQLKNIARDNNLVLKGNKKQIIDRIMANI